VNVKHQAKASSAGSTEGSGNSRGLLRRVFVTRAASLRAEGSGAPSSRLVFAPLLAALALLALALSASAALAAQTHVFTGSFGTEGSGAGQINERLKNVRLRLAGAERIRLRLLARLRLTGIAVDQQSHDLYVADRNNNRVDKFDPFGTFIRAFIGGLPTGAPA
jgi:NHL repeat